MPRHAEPALYGYTIRTDDRHNTLHTTPCKGRIFRDFGGNRCCSGCGFSWTSWGWRDELADQRAKQKEQRHG